MLPQFHIYLPDSWRCTKKVDLYEDWFQQKTHTLYKPHASVFHQYTLQHIDQWTNERNYPYFTWIVIWVENSNPLVLELQWNACQFSFTPKLMYPSPCQATQQLLSEHTMKLMDAFTGAYASAQILPSAGLLHVKDFPVEWVPFEPTVIFLKLTPSPRTHTHTHSRTHTHTHTLTHTRRKVGWLGLNWNTGCDITWCLSPWSRIISLPGTCTVSMDAACRESGLV